MDTVSRRQLFEETFQTDWTSPASQFVAIA